MSSDKTEATILEILTHIAQTVPYKNPCELNERYLHHWFSYLVQQPLGPCLADKTDANKARLLPEWPTWKEGAGLHRRKYRKDLDGHFQRDEQGTAGHLDFAIGTVYEEPTIGIEFKLMEGWVSHEGIVFDCMKMLDARLPFQLSASLNVILRPHGLVQNGKLERLKRRMKDAFDEAKERLGADACSPESRKLWLVVAEISENQRRYWHFSAEKRGFVDGFPT